VQHRQGAKSLRMNYRLFLARQVVLFMTHAQQPATSTTTLRPLPYRHM
jgi:hypothetical protein